MESTPAGDTPFEPPSPELSPTRPLPPPGPRSSPPPPPPAIHTDRWPTIDLAPTSELIDATDAQPESTVARRRFVDRFVSEEAFQNVRRHLATLALAVLVALPVALLGFFAVGSVRFAFDDRTFWDSQAHSLADLWYGLLLFVATATPPAFVLLRRGRDAAVGFVVDRGYWKVLLAVFVVIPFVIGLIAFIAGHLLAVLIVLIVLLVLLALTGGF